MSHPSFEEVAKKIVARYRENNCAHIDEWDESRYLEQKIKSALTIAYEQGMRNGLEKVK